MISGKYTRYLYLILSLLAGVISMHSHSAQAQTIVFGVAPGPYSDMIKFAIKPGLERKNYQVKIMEFSDYVQPNLALANGSIDVNLFQHLPYLKKFSADKGLKLSPLINVPTAGLGLYSKEIKSLDELKQGDVVTLSNDPTNLARGIRFLASLGLVTLKGDIDATKATERDIGGNPRGLVFKPLEAAQLPRTLDSSAASLVNGNFAIASGLKLSDAIALETLDEEIKNVVAVRTDDLNKPFVADIKTTIESPEFAAVIQDPQYIFRDFQKPLWLQKKLGQE
ncbi:metal ABC transporter substrate-binding protein [Brenneria goodwinii]|nr:metal ABC transporter substrate-binding protein [Brenneria goodwinii]MCG8162499.1 metal ABC transporter substrate-binding protein [Brenneria goodwinii]MCG8166540.1 metal ABC transporter substrate-binding protein [Brenneria goodwinii]MCG8170516.1 metal ABC transporter substrate-binding protein [Brenneria goodwinii]MCG8174484.1 metal ABC transporter substrate-binding protein [Brenneria goodwinii]